MTVEMTARIAQADDRTVSVEIPRGMEAQARRVLERCTAGYATVHISTPRRARTTGAGSQSHHINGHIQQICIATGNDFDMVKTVVKMRAISRGYPFKTLRGVVIPQSEADASIEECALLIDEVHQLAAEEGIALVEAEA